MSAADKGVDRAEMRRRAAPGTHVHGGVAMTRADVPEGAIAIVGMAGRFPGAQDVDEFWENIREGRESIARLSEGELEAAGVSRSALDDPRYVKAEAVLDRMEYLDAGFFGMSPKDAAIMDPQVRHILECAWHAMEHAGHTPERFGGSIGVFAGCGVSSYFWPKRPRQRRAPGLRGVLSPSAYGERQGFPFHPDLLQAQSDRTQRRRADGMLDFARRPYTTPARAS
ncbi:MAG: beta-ketoacyl synthase N-terminal-like domain-containing protein [Gemmatimonadota bacterium]|nr:beta-ketoacyl synthase N-terminal-like domain-containing protein [Gemmatimonadota bacterium]